MEVWRKVWREGFAPLMSADGLQALRTALIQDDGRLLQGVTISPQPRRENKALPPDGACAVAFCHWQGHDPLTVKELEGLFAASCFDVDAKFTEPGACRYFLNWFDDTQRDVMRRELLQEVEFYLAKLPAREPANATA